MKKFTIEEAKKEIIDISSNFNMRMKKAEKIAKKPKMKKNEYLVTHTISKYGRFIKGRKTETFSYVSDKYEEKYSDHNGECYVVTSRNYESVAKTELFKAYREEFKTDNSKINPIDKGSIQIQFYGLSDKELKELYLWFMRSELRRTYGLRVTSHQPKD